jgi:two-component system, NarL family, response regulator DesR
VIRVLLADDQALLLDALAAALDLQPDLDVVASVRSGDEVVAAARRTRPDVALLDVQMPAADGLSVAARLRDEIPGCRVVILTTFTRVGYLHRADEAGAVGFIGKEAPLERIVDTIRRVHAGLRVFDAALSGQAQAVGPNPLTDRERDVLRAALAGDRVAGIARALGLAESTVRNHLSAAIGKAGGRTRAEAARTAEENGWL